MPNKHTNALIGNVPIKADFHIRIQNYLEICHLLIFYTTIHTDSKIILMVYLTSPQRIFKLVKSII